MSVWDDLPGQEHAVEQLRRAAESGSPTHAWLMTGPPGSGRSNAARAFAAALLCERGTGCGECHACRTVLADSNPDVTTVVTENVTYMIEDVRELITKAQDRPASGAWRVIIMEDADRMTERTTNVLLKAIEEPPPHSVWILCAPSPADVLVTIRSRCRNVNLRVPSRESVTELLIRRDGLSPEQADFAARVSQGHIGIARRLARSEETRKRRETTVRIPFALKSASDAVRAAGTLVDLATAEATSSADDRAAEEERGLRTAFGIEADATIPPQLRSQFKNIEETRKRRARRGIHDSLDRSLLDVATVYRDILTLQLDTNEELINEHLRDQLQDVANRSSATDTLAHIDAISLARHHITSNVNPLMAVEAMMVSLISQHSTYSTSQGVRS
ncbi:DNA polymerase-3 subunit delta' [Neomicrococcus aestuarii]|uniref:DNA polymerase-3 subunit delta n=1 Tax=Neomicrococcus aestuarii TaxID=556325 RepID=A0A7W8TT95_9MICC|nr:DNA polymerase III subunit delta' [Neomicrococcus aestuarii]MBB5512378.1 DNA polymerase-3 subunit delta' [Neomicrococcus aestuarii]